MVGILVDVGCIALGLSLLGGRTRSARVPLASIAGVRRTLVGGMGGGALRVDMMAWSGMRLFGVGWDGGRVGLGHGRHGFRLVGASSSESRLLAMVE